LFLETKKIFKENITETNIIDFKKKYMRQRKDFSFYKKISKIKQIDIIDYEKLKKIKT
jgi:hypothetical protein